MYQNLRRTKHLCARGKGRGESASFVSDSACHFPVKCRKIENNLQKACKSHSFLLPLHLSCRGWLVLRCWLGKKVHGLAYHNKKDVCFTFSSDSSKRRKFHRAFSRRQRWASTHRVYLHYGIGVPFSFVWRGCILCRTQNIYPLA